MDKMLMQGKVAMVTGGGRGIGEALVREALALARREGVARVMLTSNATRRASHRLYERMGFVRYETDCFRLDL